MKYLQIIVNNINIRYRVLMKKIGKQGRHNFTFMLMCMLYLLCNNINLTKLISLKISSKMAVE